MVRQRKHALGFAVERKPLRKAPRLHPTFVIQDGITSEGLYSEVISADSEGPWCDQSTACSWLCLSEPA